ncbi:MAG: molecular chaperone [Rhodospirillaceae bacterium]|nr:molecular chaperone [Rhodospirillaceae bacterium]
MPPFTKFAMVFFLLLSFLSGSPGGACASGSVLIWPVDPVIEQGERAKALWLENRGNKPALLQVRIFSWTQIDGQDHYADQEEIVGTPPMARIEPGKRQLVRLTRVSPTPPGTEKAFRLVIDEVPMQPAETETGTPGKPVMGVQFQFRYSIPLFVYGDGLREKSRPDRGGKVGIDGEPVLACRVVAQAGQRYLEISNTGPVHARLTNAHIRQGSGATVLAEGLFGYVLAGTSIRRPLPQGVRGGAVLAATVNADPQERVMQILE